MMNSFKGYSLFRDVEDVALRTWNRCAVIFNMNQDHGEGFVGGYVNQLTGNEKAQVLAMFQYIKVKGLESARTEIGIEVKPSVLH